MRREALWDRLYLSGIDGRAAELARENGLGLEIAAFCYAPNLEDPAVLSAVRSDMAGLDRFWFHAPFAELAPCAIDPLVRQVTEKRYRQAADLAQDLGVRRLVIHGGFVPQVYFPEWYVEQSVLFWREFLRQLGFAGAFREICSSANKPYGMIASLQALDPALLARPEALISIGDHAFNDLMPISAIGGQTLWIDPYPGIHEPEYTWCVHTLAELAAFLDTIS